MRACEVRGGRAEEEEEEKVGQEEENEADEWEEEEEEEGWRAVSCSSREKKQKKQQQKNGVVKNPDWSGTLHPPHLTHHPLSTPLPSLEVTPLGVRVCACVCCRVFPPMVGVAARRRLSPVVPARQLRQMLRLLTPVLPSFSGKKRGRCGQRRGLRGGRRASFLSRGRGLQVAL